MVAPTGGKGFEDKRIGVGSNRDGRRVVAPTG